MNPGQAPGFFMGGMADLTATGFIKHVCPTCWERPYGKSRMQEIKGRKTPIRRQRDVPDRSRPTDWRTLQAARETLQAGNCRNICTFSLVDDSNVHAIRLLSALERKLHVRLQAVRKHYVANAREHVRQGEPGAVAPLSRSSEFTRNTYIVRWILRQNTL